MGLSIKNLHRIQTRQTFRVVFLSKPVQSSLDELNMMHFYVTPFTYCFQDTGQCPAVLLKVPSETFYISQ